MTPTPPNGPIERPGDETVAGRRAQLEREHVQAHDATSDRRLAAMLCAQSVLCVVAIVLREWFGGGVAEATWPSLIVAMTATILAVASARFAPGAPFGSHLIAIAEMMVCGAASLLAPEQRFPFVEFVGVTLLVLYRDPAPIATAFAARVAGGALMVVTGATTLAAELESGHLLWFAIECLVLARAGHWTRATLRELTRRQAEVDHMRESFGAEIERRTAELRAAEERFAVAVRGSSDGLWDWDVTGRRIWYSPRFRELLGFEDESAFPNTFESLTERVLAEDAERVEHAIREHLAARAGLDIDLRMKTSAGDVRWFRARGQAVWNEFGAPTRVAGSLTDVSEHRFALERVRESEATFRSLSASAPIGVFLTDAFGMCMYCNERFQQISGLSALDAMGEGWAQSIHPEDREQVFSDWYRRAREGGEFEVECRMVPGPEVDTRWVHVRAVATRGPNGAVAGYVGTVEDITDRHEHEQAMAMARDRAMEAARAKSEFLANMSHEIRTPMNGVIGMTELLMGSSLSEEQRDCVKTIHASADALLVILNDILDVSKIDAGKLSLEQVPLDLLDLAEEAADMLALRAHERGLELLVDVADDVPRALLGDPVRVRQILINLASNAIKFTEHGEVLIEVRRLAPGDGRERVRLAVRDTGVGIPAERLDAIFESFTQADGSTTRRFGGTGLGLTICRQLAQLMGGSVHVESEPGTGSTFWVELPFPLTQSGEPMSGLLLAPPALHGDEPGLRPGARVLVVDDNPRVRTILGGHLNRWGCLVEEAADADDALRRVAASSFDAVILEFDMPGLDGAAAAARMRELPGAATRSVILMAGMGISWNAEERARIGVRAVLTKPVRRAALRRALVPPALVSTPAPIETGMRDEAWSRLRVLLVEDNEVNRKVATRMLERLGCHAEIAVNGEEAVIRTESEAFDLVFKDCQMPVMDGFEATRQIRQRELHSLDRVRIVAMTANAMEGDRERCLACGMDDYISKPVQMQRLIEQLERVFDEHRRAA